MEPTVRFGEGTAHSTNVRYFGINWNHLEKTHPPFVDFRHCNQNKWGAHGSIKTSDHCCVTHISLLPLWNLLPEILWYYGQLSPQEEMLIMFTDFVIIGHPHSFTWISVALFHLRTRYCFQLGLEFPRCCIWAEGQLFLDPSLKHPITFMWLTIFKHRLSTLPLSSYSGTSI